MSKSKNKGKGKAYKGNQTLDNSKGSTEFSTTSSSPVPSQQDNAAPKGIGATQPLKPLQPEQISLEAYSHIQECLKDKQAKNLEKEDVTAVIQLSQHLRVFGLLSAVGYIRHAREGEIRKRIRPIWTPLLWRLVCGQKARPNDDKQTRQELMDATYTLSTQNQKGYMVIWRQALQLSNHWNFWARAYQKEDTDEQRTEDGNITD